MKVRGNRVPIVLAAALAPAMPAWAQQPLLMAVQGGKALIVSALQPGTEVVGRHDSLRPGLVPRR